MNKYTRIYIALYIIELILIVTGGIPVSFEISQYSGDIFGGANYFLFCNAILAIILLFIGLEIVLNKKEQIKNRKLLLTIFLILWLFIPIVNRVTWGGAVGISSFRMNIILIIIFMFSGIL